MPDDMLMGIALDQRKVLITPAKKDTAQITVVTIMGDSVKRLDFSEDFISLQTSKIGTMQIKLLPLVNNTQILGVITTVCGTACDSRIDFYTTDWKPLTQSIFPKVTKDNFLKIDIDHNSEAFQNAYATLDMTPVKLSFSAADKNIKAVYDIKSYLSVDDYKLISPFLKDAPLIYTWDKFAYK